MSAVASSSQSPATKPSSALAEVTLFSWRLARPSLIPESMVGSQRANRMFTVRLSAATERRHGLEGEWLPREASRNAPPGWPFDAARTSRLSLGRTSEQEETKITTVTD